METLARGRSDGEGKEGGGRQVENSLAAPESVLAVCALPLPANFCIFSKHPHKCNSSPLPHVSPSLHPSLSLSPFLPSFPRPLAHSLQFIFIYLSGVHSFIYRIFWRETYHPQSCTHTHTYAHKHMQQSATRSCCVPPELGRCVCGVYHYFFYILVLHTSQSFSFFLSLATRRVDVNVSVCVCGVCSM